MNRILIALFFCLSSTTIMVPVLVLGLSYHGIELITDYNYLNNDWLFGYQFGNEFNVSFSCGIFYSYYLNTLLNSRNYRYIDPEEANSLNDPAIPVGYSEDESSSRDRYEKVSDWDFGIKLRI